MSDFAHAVIIGGSSGIGLEIARLLAAAGTDILLVARNGDRLRDAAEAVRRCGTANVDIAVCDASDPDAVSALVETARRRGPIDLLVCSAGSAAAGYFDAMAPRSFSDSMANNYASALWPALAVARQMKMRGRGTIAVISSLAGERGLIGYTAYAPAKAALSRFAEALAHELKPHGVRICLAMPGDVETPLLAEEIKTRPPETTKITGGSKPISAAQAAREILAAARKGRRVVVPGRSSRWLYRINRAAPWLVAWAIDRLR
ncbi:MAG: SDR family NAD(P)-dependent oxidoreductase [Alphaproteobacteria bacterium]|nr:SDR family NAD(P)-dependent oxidoreductase [Alphaproteobacteria bacterium]